MKRRGISQRRLHSEDRSRLSAALIGAPMVGLLVWALGIPVVQSLVAASGIALIAVLSPSDRAVVALPARRPSTPLRRGVRREAMRLSWTYGRGTKGAGAPAVERLAAAARRRLQAAGLDVEEPAGASRATELLGGFAYAALIARTVPVPIRHRDLQRCVAAVEALDELMPASGAPFAAHHVRPPSNNHRPRSGGA